MPTAWTMIDASFPAFTGQEKMKDQIPVILNYMFLLSEGLKYQLSNLSGNNWNSTALDHLKVETTADLVKQMAEVMEQISGILSRLNIAAGQILQLEQDVGAIEKWQQETQEALAELDERMAEAEGALMALEDVLQTDGEGGASIGSPGKDLHLYGNIYVNDQLLIIKE